MNHSDSTTFYLFGAGSTAKLFKEVLEKENKQVKAFLTSNGSSKKRIDNTEVLNVTTDFQQIDTSIPVIISVFNREKNAHVQYITDFLNQYGIQKIITQYEFYFQYAPTMKDWYWLTDKTFYEQHRNDYQAVRTLLSDAKSVDTFDKIMEFLVSFDSAVLPLAEPENQYFPPDITIWNGKGAFLDVGSYDGQTLLDAYATHGKMQTAIAYEPDPQNILLIKDKVKGLNIANQIFFIPCGVWSKTETLSFSSGGGESSAIQENGDITIQCVSLDTTLLDVEVGYIKMDIEGAEMDALMGAKDTITTYKPTLAISLYHKPEHLFAIPLLINSWNVGYTFAIRSHGSNLLETVLYCYHD